VKRGKCYNRCRVRTDICRSTERPTVWSIFTTLITDLPSCTAGKSSYGCDQVV
jgi:hypothetical protein